MLDVHAWSEGRVRRRYDIGFARGAGELRAARELRERVRAEEFGAAARAAGAGDEFDAVCEHLVVRDAVEDRLVAAYRVLAPAAAGRSGSYCAERAFDFAGLARLRPHLVEVGGACIDEAHRHGAVIALLWFRLAEYMRAHGYRHLVGHVTVPMRDGGHNAANLFMQLGDAYLAPVDCRVAPRTRLPYERLANDQVAEVPPLVKGYLRAGAWICGEPAWNAHLDGADMLFLLPMERLAPRYRQWRA